MNEHGKPTKDWGDPIPVKIEPRYMMATKAIHKLGDISSDKPDLCRINSELPEFWVGSWVTGFGLFNVKFPKETTRPLTLEEIAYWNTRYVRIASGLSYKLNVS